MFTITFLGHAGFCVETNDAVIVMDPWFSETGAFDAGWFQYPRNHHLAAMVRRKLADPARAHYLYLSHEHQDHFDRAFIETLSQRDVRIVVPAFKRQTWLRTLRACRSGNVLALAHGRAYPIPGGSITLFIDDSGLNRDSAILVRTDEGSFLNLNDCRVFDLIPRIVECGPVDAFTCQFAGAGWHPACYEYDRETAAAIVARKRVATFDAVARAIEALAPRVYLPAAGPPCFLDPDLLRLNLDRFEALPAFRRYLEARPALHARVAEVFPGDELDVPSGTVVERAVERPSEAERPAYMERYIAAYRPLFAARAADNAGVDAAAVLQRLHAELARKLERMPFRERIVTPLYVALDDDPAYQLRVDFAARQVRSAATIAEEAYVRAAFPAWAVRKVLDGVLTWAELGLSCRATLRRRPDRYQPLIHAFLVMEADDLGEFGAMMRGVESRDDRLEIQTVAGCFSVARYCPHNGADLREGWLEGDAVLVCPRHGWRFDLARAGSCTTNESSIDARVITDPASALVSIGSGL